jgi:hypothetical protein
METGGFTEHPRRATPWNWRRFALKWVSVGVGVALTAILAIGALAWYTSRPTPPKQWNSGALVAKGPPAFSASKDAKKLQFQYAVEHTTSDDYQVDSGYQVKILYKGRDGSFSKPLTDEIDHLKLPIFIPAKQTGAITLELALAGVPTQDAAETEAAYHERVRAYCEDHLRVVSGFVLFDEVNKYQVNLPRWLAEKPTKDMP